MGFPVLWNEEFCDLMMLKYNKVADFFMQYALLLGFIFLYLSALSGLEMASSSQKESCYSSSQKPNLHSLWKNKLVKEILALISSRILPQQCNIWHNW